MPSARMASLDKEFNVSAMLVLQLGGTPFLYIARKKNYSLQI